MDTLLTKLIRRDDLNKIISLLSIIYVYLKIDFKLVSGSHQYLNMFTDYHFSSCESKISTTCSVLKAKGKIKRNEVIIFFFLYLSCNNFRFNGAPSYLFNFLSNLNADFASRGSSYFSHCKFYSWKVFRLEDINENVSGHGNHHRRYKLQATVIMFDFFFFFFFVFGVMILRMKQKIKFCKIGPCIF